MTPEPEVEQVSAPETGSTPLSNMVGEIRGWARDVFFAIGTAIMIVVFLYQPVKVEGTSMLPVLGDHRNQSNDSRMWGLVPEKYIYGKAVFRYWPIDKMGSLD